MRLRRCRMTQIDTSDIPEALDWEPALFQGRAAELTRSRYEATAAAAQWSGAKHGVLAET